LHNPMRADKNIHTSIIIPTRNHAALLQRVVAGLRDTSTQFTHALELLVVDNSSDEPDALRFLESLSAQTDSPFANIQILRYPHKFNYSAMNNMAVKNCGGEYLCFLNNDVEVIDSSWLDAMHNTLAQDGSGCVGALLYYPDDTIQHAGVYLDPTAIAGHLYKHFARGAKGKNDFLLNEQEVSGVTAACAVAFNGVDLCLKVRRAGYKNRWTPHAELYHHESKSRGQSHERHLWQKIKHKFACRTMQRRGREQLSSDPHRHNHPCDQTLPAKPHNRL